MKTLLVLTLVFLSACQRQSVVKDLSGNLNGKPEVGVGTTSLRHAGQIRESMAQVTGVDPLDNTVTNYYNGALSRFSLDGDALTVSPSLLLSTLALAGVFCNRLVANEVAISQADASNRLIFQRVDFNRNQTGLTPDVRQDVFKKLAQQFWRREATQEELNILNTAMDEALDSRPLSAAETRNALIITCTAALSSLDFIKS